MGFFTGGTASAQSPGDLAAQLDAVTKQIDEMEKNGNALGGDRYKTLLAQQRLLIQQIEGMKK